MSEIYEIADAVKARMLAPASPGPVGILTPTNGLWPASFYVTPTRTYRPSTELATLGPMMVAILPTADNVTKGSRTSKIEDITINVGVLSKIDGGTDPAAEIGNDVLDPLVKFCRAVALMFSSGDMAGDAVWTESKYPVMFDTERLKKERVFLAIITFTFKQAN